MKICVTRVSNQDYENRFEVDPDSFTLSDLKRVLEENREDVDDNKIIVDFNPHLPTSVLKTDILVEVYDGYNE